MSMIARSRGLALALLMIAACGCGAAAAQSSGLPEHAKASRYGTGWNCVSGFKRVDDACVSVTVPANGYLDASGSGWKCNRG